MKVEITWGIVPREKLINLVFNVRISIEGGGAINLNKLKLIEGNNGKLYIEFPSYLSNEYNQYMYFKCSEGISSEIKRKASEFYDEHIN